MAQNFSEVINKIISLKYYLLEYGSLLQGWLFEQYIILFSFFLNVSGE